MMRSSLFSNYSAKIASSPFKTKKRGRLMNEWMNSFYDVACSTISAPIMLHIHVINYFIDRGFNCVLGLWSADIARLCSRFVKLRVKLQIDLFSCQIVITTWRRWAQFNLINVGCSETSRWYEKLETETFSNFATFLHSNWLLKIKFSLISIRTMKFIEFEELRKHLALIK